MQLQLRKWRRTYGLTQRNLADASDLDLRWIQKLESGEINIENITVKKFSKLLKGICDLSGSDSSNDEMKQVREASECLELLLKSESR